eukprot:TRINITY_DN45703_c0_g1_i3.p3 TRINITY_DN45703_c0_g1~~TRINITY_DN45703_c0_g1_i3.p3  ORF type:complete len:116 (+),score=7.79 TRINITY_DN45703_c0_g1_i3:593-940(+)
MCVLCLFEEVCSCMLPPFPSECRHAYTLMHTHRHTHNYIHTHNYTHTHTHNTHTHATRFSCTHYTLLCFPLFLSFHLPELGGKKDMYIGSSDYTLFHYQIPHCFPSLFFFFLNTF